MADWCRFNGSSAVFIDPGSPWQNAWIESFNGRLRDEFLNGQLFETLFEAKVGSSRWPEATRFALQQRAALAGELSTPNNGTSFKPERNCLWRLDRVSAPRTQMHSVRILVGEHVSGCFCRHSTPPITGLLFTQRGTLRTTNRDRFARRLSICLVVCGLASALALVSTGVAAAVSSVLYVAGGGSNAANACTNAGDPCATVSYALTQAAAGDTIDVSGSVADNVVVPSSLTPLTIAGISTPAVLSEGTVGSVLEIDPGAGVIVEGVTIEGGAAFLGGGIENLGSLSISDSTVSGNLAEGGGGIYNDGSLSLDATVISGNQAISTGSPAGVGGGIFNLGTLTVDGSTISANSVVRAGGVNEGAGIYDRGGSVSLAGSTVSSNSAQSAGGGLYVTDGSLEVDSSTISGNNAGSEGGGLYSDSPSTIAASTLSDNSAAVGGGVYTTGTLAIVSSTVAANSAGPAGGGIENTGTLSVFASTIAANMAPGGGGAIANSGGGTSIGGSIVAGNTAPECVGSVTDDPGYNLEDDSADTCGFTGLTDVTANPDLQPLGQYGGPTETMALQAGSPALDLILNPTPGLCPGTDQRGVLRPQGDDCDLGAFELATLTVQAPSPTITYGGAIPTLVPSYAGLLDGLSGPSTPATCTTTATSASPPGQYPVVCSGAVDPDYAIVYLSGTLTIGFTQPCVERAVGGFVVGSGQAVCIGRGGLVFGRVAVQPGGSLWMSHGVVVGLIISNGAAALGACSSLLVGSVNFLTTAGPVDLGGPQCGGDLVVGAVRISNGRGGVSFANNTVLGLLTITNNTGGFSFTNNLVLGRELIGGNS